jgi:hypothetical protein
VSCDILADRTGSLLRHFLQAAVSNSFAGSDISDGLKRNPVRMRENFEAVLQPSQLKTNLAFLFNSGTNKFASTLKHCLMA